MLQPYHGGPVLLCRSRPPPVSTATAKKAIWLVLHKESHLWCQDVIDEDTGKKSYVYYVLVQDNELRERKLNHELIAKYESTLQGKKPKHLRPRYAMRYTS